MGSSTNVVLVPGDRFYCPRGHSLMASDAERRRLHRANRIRDARQAINAVSMKSKRFKIENPDWQDEDGPDPDNALVPVAFLEAIAVWLDKALATAKFQQDDALPEGEVDHAQRVACAYFGDTLDNGGYSPVQTRSKKGKEGMR